MYNGTDKVPATMFWSSGLPATRAPFYYDGITYDEFLVEEFYRNYLHHANITRKYEEYKEYKTIKQQLIDGDIKTIPDMYKTFLPYPENCTAYRDLIKKEPVKTVKNRRRAIKPAAVAAAN